MSRLDRTGAALLVVLGKDTIRDVILFPTLRARD
jgi:hypothetical protein